MIALLVRCGNIIRSEDGKGPIETFESINKAKKASRKLPKGSVRVIPHHQTTYHVPGNQGARGGHHKTRVYCKPIAIISDEAINKLRKNRKAK